MLKGEAPLIDRSDISSPSLTSPKKDEIIVFLEYVGKNWSREIEIDIPESITEKTQVKRKLIMGFYTPHDLFNYFEMLFDEISMSYSWFRRIWLTKFSYLICSKDRACPTCNFYLQKMKESEGKNNNIFKNAKTILNQHQSDFKDIRDSIETCIADSRVSFHSEGMLIFKIC